MLVRCHGFRLLLLQMSNFGIFQLSAIIIWAAITIMMIIHQRAFINLYRKEVDPNTNDVNKSDYDLFKIAWLRYPAGSELKRRANWVKLGFFLELLTLVGLTISVLA